MDVRPDTPPLPFAPPPPDFDDLVEGENRDILAAARALAAGDAVASSLYIWGGGGKTALLRTTAAGAQRHSRGFYVGGDSDIPPPMPALLAADDIHLISENNRLLLFDWHNKIRPGANYRILAAADAPPSYIGIGEEIAARFYAGLVFRLREISESEKRRALSRYARRRGFVLPEQVINFLLSRLPRDMPSLTAAVADLDAFLLARAMPLNAQSAGKWWRRRVATAADNFHEQ